MQKHRSRTRILARTGLAALALAASTLVALAQTAPTIRFGRQTAAEENLWLMIARPDLAPNLGKTYNVDWTQFRASDAAFKAMESNQVDMVSTNANSAITAASKGLNHKIIAALSKESEEGANTKFLVRTDGPKTIADLKGKTIGIVGYRTGVELWARQALKSGGLNPDRDISWAVLPFAATAEALRANKIGAGAAVELFALPEVAKGDVRILFTSKTGVPFDEELIVIVANPDFLKKSPGAVKDFLADLVTVNKYYLANLEASRRTLIEKQLVPLPPEVFLKLKDYKRDPDLVPSVTALAQQQDILKQAGFVESTVKIADLVDTSFLAKK